MPPYALLLGCLLAVKERAHAMVIERVRLDQVDDVELVTLALASVCHAEEVPLGKNRRRAVVLLEFEIIFKLRNLDSLCEIARFKPTFKNESAIIGSFQIVVVL